MSCSELRHCVVWWLVRWRFDLWSWRSLYLVVRSCLPKAKVWNVFWWLCIAWLMVVQVRMYIVVMTLCSLVSCYRRLKFGLWSSGFLHRVVWLIVTVVYQTTRYQSPDDHGLHFHLCASLEFRRPVTWCLQPTNATVHTALRATEIYDCCSWCCSVRSHVTQIEI